MENPHKGDRRAGNLDDRGAQQGPTRAPSAGTVLLGAGNAQVRQWGALDSNPQPTDLRAQPQAYAWLGQS